MIITQPSNNDKCIDLFTFPLLCNFNRYDTVNVSATVAREGYGNITVPALATVIVTVKVTVYTLVCVMSRLHDSNVIFTIMLIFAYFFFSLRMNYISIFDFY